MFTNENVFRRRKGLEKVFFYDFVLYKGEGVQRPKFPKFVFKILFLAVNSRLFCSISVCYQTTSTCSKIIWFVLFIIWKKKVFQYSGTYLGHNYPFIHYQLHTGSILLLKYQTNLRIFRFDTLGKLTPAHHAGAPWAVGVPPNGE